MLMTAMRKSAFVYAMFCSVLCIASSTAGFLVNNA
jgi:hypothetical protein